jgi:hypothetical protein
MLNELLSYDWSQSDYQEAFNKSAGLAQGRWNRKHKQAD